MGVGYDSQIGANDFFYWDGNILWFPSPSQACVYPEAFTEAEVEMS